MFSLSLVIPMGLYSVECWVPLFLVLKIPIRQNEQGKCQPLNYSVWSPRLASPLKMHLSRDTQTKAVAVPGCYTYHDISPSHLYILLLNGHCQGFFF